MFWFDQLNIWQAAGVVIVAAVIVFFGLRWLWRVYEDWRYTHYYTRMKLERVDADVIEIGRRMVELEHRVDQVMASLSSETDRADNSKDVAPSERDAIRAGDDPKQALDR